MKSTKSGWIAVVLATCLMLAGMFAPLWSGDRILAPFDVKERQLSPWSATSDGERSKNHAIADAVTQYLPYRQFAEKGMKEDGWIGWNPYEMGGCSLAGNTMALPATWTMQLHRFLPFVTAWHAGLMLEFALAGLGMGFFLRSRGMAPWIVALGTVAYLLNTQFTVWVHHRWALGSFALMPWLLWVMNASRSWKRPGWALPLAGVILALTMTGASLQHVAILGIGCAVMGLCGYSKEEGLKGWTRKLGGWGAVGALGLAMAAFTLVPQVMAYLENLAVGHSRGGIGYAAGLKQPILQTGMIGLQAWPWLLGDPSSVEILRVLKLNTMDLAYFGTIPTVLALVALFHPGLPRQAKGLVLAGLLVPLTPLVGPLYHRVQLLFILGGCWLMAEWLTLALQREERPKWLKPAGFAVAALVAGCLVFGLLPEGLKEGLKEPLMKKALEASKDSNLSGDPAWIQARVNEWVGRLSLFHPRTAIALACLAAGWLGLRWAWGKDGRSRQAGLAVVTTACAVELLTFFHGWVAFTDASLLTKTDPSIEMVRELAGDDRVAQRSPDAGFRETFGAPNVLASMGVRSIDGYESIQARTAWYCLREADPELRLTLTGVAVAVHPENGAPQEGAEGWPEVSRMSGQVIRRNPVRLPRWAAGEGSIPEEAAEVPARIESRGVASKSETMSRWAVEVPAGSSWLRACQNWHQGWKWRLNGGEWRPFVMGPDGCAWVSGLEAGGLVEAEFEPRPGWASGLSLGALALMLALGWGASRWGRSGSFL